MNCEWEKRLALMINYAECSEIFDKVPKENYYLIRYEQANSKRSVKKQFCNESNSRLSLKYYYT